jgi:hypothetical protein
MSRLRLAPIGLLSALVLAACVGIGGTPGSSATTASSATIAPSGSPVSTIAHPTGPTDVILRMATGGGFVGPGVLLTEIPEFTLYGDGTLIFRDPATSYIEPSPLDGVARRTPFRSARLAEAEVQAVLADAIGPGGLGTAQELYMPCCIADAPSTVFTLDAGDLDKTVTVGALGFESPNEGPDHADRKAFQDLARRLLAPDLGAATASPYEPADYRGILSGGVDPGTAVVGTPRRWPWMTFGPEGFQPSADAGGPLTPTRTLSAADVAALGIADLEGGADSIALKTSDGRVYGLALRPLLPDEKA